MADLVQQPLVMEGAGWADYGLVDSGHGRKLERYGPHRFIRPEPQALWSPRLAEWPADGEFVPGSDEDGGGRWHFAQPVPEDGWPLAWNEVRFTAQCTPFRHLGFFPDMAPVWEWMRGRLVPPRNGEGDHPQDGGGAPAGNVPLAERAPPPSCGWPPSPFRGGTSRPRIHSHTGAMSGKKPRWRNGVHCAVKRTSFHASGQPSSGTGWAKCQRPPPSSSLPGTNSPSAGHCASRGLHKACGSGRMKRWGP